MIIKKFPFLSIIDLLFKSFRGIILNSNSVCFQSIKNGLLVARSDQDLQGITLATTTQDTRQTVWCGVVYSSPLNIVLMVFS